MAKSLLVFVCLALSPLVQSANIQSSHLVLPSDAPKYRQQVKDAFTMAYGTYSKIAFGHDDLQPVSKSFDDSRNGWGATIIDSMSTMVVMGLDDLYKQAVQFAGKIDFQRSKTPATVSVFETTIRYVGGLLSAYELAGRKDPILVQKAQEVANKLAFAWVGNNAIPYGQMNFTTNKPVINTANIAEAGTLSLEFTLLSQLTGNQTYANLAQKSVKAIAAMPGVLPGLPAQGIDPTTTKPVGSYVTWGGGSDSYFEYLIKFARLFPNSDSIYATAWLKAVDTSIKDLLKVSTVQNRTYLADFDGTRIRHVGSHLACFHAGNWIMGGRLLNNQTIVNIALQLNEACWNTYAGTATGIGPESFAYISSDGDFTGGSTPSAAQLAFYKQHGYYITGADYILRPEVLESNFYAYRLTGDYKYQQRAQAALASFNRVLVVNQAYAGINDVNQAKGGGFIDDTESFFYAEVLKYLYLTFDDPNHISLDKYVFNTECHPFTAGPAQINVGSSTTQSPFQPSVPLDGDIPQISFNPKLPAQVADLLNIPNVRSGPL